MKSEKINELVNDYKLPEPVYITRPTMPDLSEYNRYLEQIWETQWLTNDGQFQERLKQYLETVSVPEGQQCFLVNNIRSGG